MVSGDVQPLTLIDLTYEEVHGESYRQAALQEIVADRGTNRITALLRWAPTEEHANAVGVYLLTRNLTPLHIGYLPSGHGDDLIPTIRKANAAGHDVALPAAIFGGTPDKPSYGAWLGTRFGPISPDELAAVVRHVAERPPAPTPPSPPPKAPSQRTPKPERPGTPRPPRPPRKPWPLWTKITLLIILGLFIFIIIIVALVAG